MLKPRAKLLDHKAAIEIYEKIISDSSQEKDRIISVMKELNLQGNVKQVTFDYLQSSYELQDKKIKDIQGKLDKERNILLNLHKDFAKKCISEYGRLSVSITPIIISARQELDNDEDSSIFENAVSQSMVRMERAFEKLLSARDEEE